MLDQAGAAVEQRDLDGGWLALLAARRLLFDEKARETRTAAIKAEASQKLFGWRRKLVDDLLATTPEGGVPSLDRLREAQRTLDHHFANTYRRIDLYANRIGFVDLVLAAFLVAFYVATANGWLDNLDSSSSLRSTKELLAIMLLGAVGSMLSLALTRVSPSRQPVPQLIESGYVDVLRLLLGPASAIVLVLILESGLENTVDASGSKVYVWAVLAGFSERLLRRTLESVADSAERRSAPE